jgi:hypothetical protein
MTVYILILHEYDHDGDQSHVWGVYADQSEAEAAGERLTGRRRLYTHYTVEQEVVIGG